MFDYSAKQYVFKDSKGLVRDFFYDGKMGLCCSSLSKRNTWSDAASIHRDTLPWFYADMDESDEFHLFYQDLEGNLLYSKYDRELTTLPILSGKSASVYNKHLFLLPAKNNVQLFYVLQYKDSLILSQQSIQDGKAGPPRAVDYVHNLRRPYTVLQDKAGNIYLFYQASDGNFLQVGYRKSAPPWKQWSEFSAISRFDGRCEYPCALLDGRGILHICYQRYFNKEYELVYQQKLAERNLWTKEQVIYASAYSFENAFMISVQESLVIFWVRDDIIYSSASQDGGNNWSKPLHYGFPSVRQLLCMSYKANTPYESGKVWAETVPGSFVNGLKLAFFQDPAASASELTAEELRNIILDSLKLLKASNEELKESQAALQESISRVHSLQQQTERERIKLAVKLEMMEKDMDDLRSAFANAVKEKDSPNGKPLQTT